MTNPTFTFSHLHDHWHDVYLSTGDLLGAVEIEDGLVAQFEFFHASVQSQADAAQLLVEIGEAWRAKRRR